MQLNLFEEVKTEPLYWWLDIFPDWMPTLFEMAEIHPCIVDNYGYQAGVPVRIISIYEKDGTQYALVRINYQSKHYLVNQGKEMHIAFYDLAPSFRHKDNFCSLSRGELTKDNDDDLLNNNKLEL